ncbi:AraC family transcriptional regulator [Nocardia colli]|uniref:AraC family transcriptional regulator n=1 Tax=Nocardia colli TaxID=2545717 RepID=A0A5N0E9W9_9NOCA|nr:helix-turn-helix domain-containing protein [Nocardia colli]KAA8886222.1 AraC family transcriptional regulator [Nocardia colli]
MDVPGEVRRTDGAKPHWSTAFAAPAVQLDRLVSSYGWFREVSARPMVRQELPTPKMILLISLAGPLSLARGITKRDSCRSAAALVGVGREPVVAVHNGYQSVLEVQLSPLSALELFGVSASIVADDVIDLADLWTGTTEFVERLTAATTWQQRIGLLDTTLTARITRGRRPDPALTAAWQHLLDCGGDLDLSVLREQTGWSRRRLAERFRAQVGLPPKTMARLMRFQRAVDLLRSPGHRSLAAIASTCGYCDQPHFNREFRELAGRTPTAFLAEMQADLPGTDMAAAAAAAQTSKTPDRARF